MRGEFPYRHRDNPKKWWRSEYSSMIVIIDAKRFFQDLSLFVFLRFFRACPEGLHRKAFEKKKGWLKGKQSKS